MSEPISGLAVVPPGLEAPAAAELTALGAHAVMPLRRAVRFQTDLAGFYRLHLQARLPFRLLRELTHFPCSGKDDLYDGVQLARTVVEAFRRLFLVKRPALLARHFDDADQR